MNYKYMDKIQKIYGENVSKTDAYRTIALLAVVSICFYFNELGIIFPVLMSYILTAYFVDKGWPGHTKGVSLIILCSGLPFYILFVLFGVFGFTDEINEAKIGRQHIDDNISEYSENVDYFLRHIANDTVYVVNEDLDRETKEVGPISKKVISFYLRGLSTFMPSSLGPDPIFPIRSAFNSGTVVFMLDVEGAFRKQREVDMAISSKLGIPVEEISIEDRVEFGAFENGFPFSYSCLVGADGDILHIQALDPKTSLLDLSEDPIFSPIGDACKRFFKTGIKGSIESYDVVKERMKAIIGN